MLVVKTVMVMGMLVGVEGVIMTLLVAVEIFGVEYVVEVLILRADVAGVDDVVDVQSTVVKSGKVVAVVTSAGGVSSLTTT